MIYGYGEVYDKKQMVKFIYKVLELGINFFDIVEVYGEDNEKFLGEVIKFFKDKVVVVSKFGIYYVDFNDKYVIMFLDFSFNCIKSVIEGSLKCLKVECIDLYY